MDGEWVCARSGASETGGRSAYSHAVREQGEGMFDLELTADSKPLKEMVVPY